MLKLSCARLPLLLKAALLAAGYGAWLLFEELVIDRYGLWRFLPLYEKGYFCTWDAAALLLLGGGLLRLAHPAAAGKATCPVRRHLRGCPLCA